MRHWYYPRCDTSNRWHSFHAHSQDGAGSVSLLLLPIKEASTSIRTICNQCPLRLPSMQDLTSLMLRWCSFPGWGRERLSTYFDHKGGRYIPKEQCRTIVNILQLTVGHLNATINRTIWNSKPKIGPDSSCQTLQNPFVDRYGAGFWPPRSRRMGFQTVLDPNRTVFPVQTRTAGGLPGPVANTRFGPSTGGPASRSGVPGQVITHYKGSTAKETDLCRYCHCTPSASKFPTSTCDNGTTTSQTLKVIPPQQIIRVWLCTICPRTGASQQG